ncbi:Starch-binding associating with outer membrane [Niabella drilacis]|uniref:Starch-binding associating with outer membrane n=2 Tax=Niabella drilacis (strain DSM 25811 / CCM 8410 / CCUG 62505 / LMG 26954 / E90) TaxID=1285928 RepID=A0A1G6N694_NIADE|nr:Starch-binding associating with outer membrane [Niabella drilacis]
MLAPLLFFLGGCKRYLDVAPDNIGTIDYAFRMRKEAEKYLFTCYNNLPQLGTISSDPAFIGGDEFATIYPPGIYFDPALYRIARGEQNKISPFANYWDGGNGGRSYFQALRECNIFLENVDKVPDLTDFEKKRWVAEVKFLKAYYHFYLFQLYGPIPLIKVNLPVSASIEEVRIKRQPVDSVVNYISDLIDESLFYLPDEISNKSSELGRITKPIALAVKARLLVVAASPLYNGNPDYANFKNKDGAPLFNAAVSQEKWVRAAAACKAAIDAAHAAGNKLYTFIPSFGETVTDSTKTVLSITGALTDKWNTETVWGLSNAYVSYIQAACQARVTSGDPSVVENPPSTNESIRSDLAASLNMAEMFYSNNGVPIEEDKQYDYANRFTKLRTAKSQEGFYLKRGYETAQLHFDREPRFYADLGFDGSIWYGLGLYDDSKTWFVEAKHGQRAAQLGAGLYSVTGYWPKKLVNYRNDFGSNSAGYSTRNYPWPAIRLAELYLLYAEALNEANGPGAAYEWIDKVRARAGLKGVQESWSSYAKNASKPSTKEGLREIIQRETLIELVFEGKRFWDLRRWKTAPVYLNTPIKGWDLAQEDAVNYYRVKQLFAPTFTPKDYLWPLSEYALVVNPNLVQNPGW